MSDTPLVRKEAASSRAGTRRFLLSGIIVVALLAVAAAGGWWYVAGRETPPDWDRVAEIALRAPAGDAFDDETPWVTLRMAPLRPGQENTLQLAVQTHEGTPVAGETEPRIVGLTVQPVGSGGAETVLDLQPVGDAPGALQATAQLDQSGWWRIGIEVDGSEQGARFFLLVPDPNINGPGAVPRSASTAEGEALFERAMSALTSLQSVRYTQWLSDGKGNAGISEHAVTAGGDGAPPGFTYRAPEGMEAIVIDSTRWVRLPGDFGWTVQEGAASVPPSEWGAEYAGATDFTILGEATIDGAQTQILSFVVPEVTEPRRQTAAWYLWWVDTETGNIRRETMVSRVHYMLNEFSGFDLPVALEPPEMPATPGTGTPVP